MIVLPDGYSSDIQQTVISKAKFVVGARYHSIVFAINNSIPFVALSYEHKMVGLLSLLKKDKQQIDICKIGTNNFDYRGSISQFEQLIQNLTPEDTQVRMQANQLAANCLDDFCSNFIAKFQRD